jgi:hypothetical protein
MKPISAVVGGVAGASTLTILHETMRRIDPKAPRMDLLGMNALAKILKSASPARNHLFKLALGGDLVSNSMYYSLAGTGNPKHIWKRATLLGLGAGLGAIFLPGPMGLDASATNKTLRTRVMTVAFYMIAGYVAAATISAIENKKQKNRFKRVQLSDFEG